MVALGFLVILVIIGGAIVIFEQARELRAWRAGQGFRGSDGEWVGPRPPKPDVRPAPTKGR